MAGASNGGRTVKVARSGNGGSQTKVAEGGNGGKHHLFGPDDQEVCNF